MNTLSHSLSNAVSDEITQIRNVYQEYFDRSWFTSAFREFPMDARQLQEIRHALSLTQPTIWDLPVLHRGVAALKEFIRIVRQSVLPRAKNMFGITPSIVPGFRETQDSRLQRRLVLYTLPLNLDRLSSHVLQLDRLLPPIPVSMPSLRAVPVVRAAI